MRRINRDDGWITIESDDGLGGFTFPAGLSNVEALIALITPEMLEAEAVATELLLKGDPATRHLKPRGIFNT